MVAHLFAKRQKTVDSAPGPFESLLMTIIAKARLALPAICIVLLATSPAKAQDGEAAWSDAAIWETIGETHGLERKLRSRIFDSITVQDEIRRGGVMPACEVIGNFIKRTTESRSEEYRGLVLPAVRAVVPDGKTFQERVTVSPSGHRFVRVLDRLERETPHLFEDMYIHIDSELVPQLAHLPAIHGEWRGPFADWDFDGPNQSVWQSACLNASLSNPTRGKAAFDGFYKERDTQ